MQAFTVTAVASIHIQYMVFTWTCKSINTQMPKHTKRPPPARRLNKNPPTTPDVHHRLSWPPRNIPQGCQGSRTLHQPVTRLGRKEWMNGHHYIYMCVFHCYVRMCLYVWSYISGLNDSNQWESCSLLKWNVNGWVDEAPKQPKWNGHYVRIHVYFMITLCLWHKHAHTQCKV